MKKLNLIPIFFILTFISACNIFDTSSDQGFEYKFKTDKKAYTSKDTVKAIFTNKSTHTLFLHHNPCLIVGMQKLENDFWKSISIPVVCLAHVAIPVKVEPGEKFKTGIKLQIFRKNKLESGIYRFEVVASLKGGNQQKELTSNNFKIRK